MIMEIFDPLSQAVGSPDDDVKRNCFDNYGEGQ